MPDNVYVPGNDMQSTQETNQLRQVIDMSKEILQLDAERAPFYIMTAQMAKETCHNYRFFWQEDKVMDHIDHYDGADQTSVPAQGASQTISVEHAQLFLPNDLVLVSKTDEIMRVTAVSVAGGTITANRGYADTAPMRLENGDELQILAPAREQGADDFNINLRQVSTPYNFTQIMSTEWGISRTNMNTEYYGPDEIDRMRFKKGIEFTEKIERNLLWSERSIDTSGDDVLTTTRGVTRWITDNVTDMGGNMTESDFDDFCANQAFAHGDDEKTMFCSNTLLSRISGFAKNHIVTETPEENYGIRVRKYITPHGELSLVRHKMLQGEVWGKAGIVVDMNNVKQRVLKNSDVTMKTNVQTALTDGLQEQLICEIGLELSQQEHFALVHNV